MSTFRTIIPAILVCLIQLSCTDKSGKNLPDSTSNSVNTNIDERGDFSFTIAIGREALTCSGSKIGDNLILTAAHCVDDISKKGLSKTYDSGAPMILTNQARGERVGGEYSLLTVRNIHFPESWLTAKGSCDPKTAFENYCWIHNNIGMQDFAIIETVEKIRDVQIAEVLAADVKPGQKVEFSGYGRKITDLQIMKNKINYYSGIDASRRFSDGLVGDASVIQTYKALTTEYVEEVAKKLTDTNYIVLAALDSFGRPKMSWSGDSGGPLVSITGGQKKIIGVFAGTLNTKDDLLKVESEYPPYTLFAKVDSGVANWISKVKAEVQVAAGDSNPAMVAFRCRFDGKLFTSFLARNEASNSYSLIASRSKNGISAKQVTGVLDGGLNEIVISLADGELRRDTKVDQVGRILLKRTNDLTEGGFSWEADGTIETTSNGRPAIIQAVCSVNGNPGVLSAFFSNKTKE